MSFFRNIPRWFYKIKRVSANERRVRILCFSFKIKDKNEKVTEQDQTRYNGGVKDILRPLYDNYEDDFVPLSLDSYERHDIDPKFLAYYLPQFHSIPLNDKNFGKGFTEWFNVTKAKPQFFGHHQPQLPIDVGFYNLSHDDVMHRQIELAKQYGIYGFCFYYYWFGKDKRLLEKPLYNWLNNKELNMPFCLCWANENWSTLWDGGERNVIMEQKIDENSHEDFIEDIIEFFKDERYIRMNNEPVLLIYRPTMFKKKQFVDFVDGLQNAARKRGISRVRVLITNAMQDRLSPVSCTQWHVDGMVEFPPHGVYAVRDFETESTYLQDNDLKVYDMAEYIDSKIFLEAAIPEGGKLYKASFPSWDNTARKTHSGGSVFLSCTPARYKQWLKDNIEYSRAHLPEDEQFIFINAWNEWAEGAHLEPDQRYGYAYLKATREAIEEMRRD